MPAVSISQGWKIFFAALKEERWWSLRVAAEWMYRLNVFARSNGRHVINEQIYELKNHLIQYLYQSGYSYEVRQQIQKKECWRCEGTGQYWTGADCWKCNGTGVFARVELYAFRFNIDGQRYGWHQLKRLVNYQVDLTESQPGEYSEPKHDAAILKLQDAWLGCCVVWWCLVIRGRFSHSILFDALRNRIKYVLGITAIEAWIEQGTINLSYWWQHQTLWRRRHNNNPWDESDYFEVRELQSDEDDMPVYLTHEERKKP